MSLYEYIVPVTPEQAEQYKKYVRALQTRSYNDYSVYDQAEKIGLDFYQNGLEIGRPFFNSLTTFFGGQPEESFMTAADRLFKYGQPVVLDERVGGTLLNAAETDKQREWLTKNAGQTVVLVNDNEF